MMQPDAWSLYRKMLVCRLFEEAVSALWEQGRIYGEMHSGAGEEGVTAGVMDHFREGDAMALDHRGTAPLLLAGADPLKLLLEFLGHPGGLCGGMGGHMHLYSRERLAASSGIVGASGPAAAGFALAGKRLRPGSVAVAFFGEGALNQGMMMESMNLASVWKLPVLFVCKDNGWAITTESKNVTAGTPAGRAKAFDIEACEADGGSVVSVWEAAGRAFGHIRDGKGPCLLHARCVHLEGHFLGDQLLRLARRPIREMPRIAGPVMRSWLSRGGTDMSERTRLVKYVASLGPSLASANSRLRDPIAALEKVLGDGDRRKRIRDEVAGEIGRIVREAAAETEAAR